MRGTGGRGLALVLALAVWSMPAGGEPRSAKDMAHELTTVEQQLVREAEIREALAAFAHVTLEEFAALPLEDMQRTQFVWKWAEHYRRARLGERPGLPSVGEEPDEARRASLKSFDPTAMKSGMGTDGAARVADDAMPLALHACAEAHEAQHEQDLHAQARRLAREWTVAHVADGSLSHDTAYLEMVRAVGRERATDTYAEALFEQDLAGNRQFVATQRADGYAGPVRMLTGPLRAANVYYGHMDPRESAEENYQRAQHMAAFELRAYAVSTVCLEETAGRLRAERDGIAAEG